jgi:glycosyltransferase involved in cell wall biosynthesis
MAGDGPQRAAWERRAARANVQAAFPGWLEASRRAAAIAGASVLAVPSLWPEPFGLAGLEAAALGVPAIAFDVGGIPEWLHHRVNGLLVPARGGAEAFAAALVEVLGDTRLRESLSAGAVQRAAEMSVAVHVDALADVLRQAAALPRTQVAITR